MTIEEHAAQTAEWKASGQYSCIQGVLRPAFLLHKTMIRLNSEKIA